MTIQSNATTEANKSNLFTIMQLQLVYSETDVKPALLTTPQGRTVAALV